MEKECEICGKECEKEKKNVCVSELLQGTPETNTTL